MKKVSLIFITVGIFALGSNAFPKPPSDPYFSQQWSLKNDGTQIVTIDIDDSHTVLQKGTPGIDIGFLNAQDQVASQAKSPVIVAVIDSGIDPTHPDLQGRISSEGYDFLSKSATLTDEIGHGTHVSGSIAANADNGVGIVGVAPATVKILPLKILSDDYNNFAYQGKLISDYAADAIDYAVAHHASVINMSLSWPKIVDTEKARTAVQNAIKKGVAIVVSAGNDRKNDPTFPCAYEGVLCVGSITNTGKMALYSNTGGLVDLLAPGDGILSLYPLNVESKTLRIQGYELLSGTSQAAPHVAGIAAVIKSIYPTISLNELKARLLVSAGEKPQADSSLYGLVNLPRAIQAKPKPVYLPDFKAVNEIAVDEVKFRASGSLNISNLWADASNVRVSVWVNGVAAGSGAFPKFQSGKKVTIPWHYSFKSLSDSSNLRIYASIVDSSRQVKEFTVDIPAVRQMQNLPSQDFASLAETTWMGSTNGHLYSRLNQVAVYGTEVSIPAYFQQLALGSVQIFDPSSPSPVTQLNLPTIQKVSQVIRMDANRDGEKDWLITGLAAQGGQIFFEFYFLDPKFQPLWSSSSAWQIPCNGTDCTPYLRDYTAPGSWVQFNGKLIPSYMTQGGLPPADNFDSLDPRHYQSDVHLFYLVPETSPGPNPSNLEVHVLDNAAFRLNLPNLHLQNFIPQNEEDSRQGHLRMILENGSDLNAQSMIWDIPSLEKATLQAVSGWDSLSSSGKPILSSPENSDAFLSFFDEQSGSLAWSTPQGRFVDRTEFSFSSPENPIVNLIGVFDLQSLGRVWFAESGFDMIAFEKKADGSAVISHSLPLERDSSFTTQVFSETLSPILLGNSSNPLPGVYIDSTLVNVNRVAVALLDPVKGGFAKPLRYSLQIPSGCVQMSPIHLSDAPDSFRQPLLCQKLNQISYSLVQP